MRTGQEPNNQVQIEIDQALISAFGAWKARASRNLSEQQISRMDWIGAFIRDAKTRLRHTVGEQGYVETELEACINEYCDYLREQQRAERWMTRKL